MKFKAVVREKKTGFDSKGKQYTTAYIVSKKLVKFVGKEVNVEVK